MCLYPRLIRNRKYVPNKKNGGIVPEVKDKRVLSVPVGCGKCLECKKQKSREWQVRLQEDIRANRNAKFVTFTFSEHELEKLESKIKLEGYDRDNEVCRIAVRRFTERWRKKYSDEEKELLWLEKLDKEIRYVDGVAVDIAETEEEYYKLLEVKRQKSKRLGYGDDEVNWELKNYENERRNLIKLDRIKKKYGLADEDLGRVSLKNLIEN
jgi:hypothetical protein